MVNYVFFNFWKFSNFFRTNVIELEINLLLKNTPDILDVPQCQAFFFNMNKLIYLNNFEKLICISALRKLDTIAQKSRNPVFACIRQDLVSNEYLFYISKAIIISKDENISVLEEKFTEHSDPYLVSILTRPSSGRLEIDDRFEFTISDGLKVKRMNTTILNLNESTLSESKTSGLKFNLGTKTEIYVPDALILIEDSDRDSEDEMEADSNF